MFKTELAFTLTANLSLTYFLKKYNDQNHYKYSLGTYNIYEMWNKEF